MANEGAVQSEAERINLIDRLHSELAKATDGHETQRIRKALDEASKENWTRTRGWAHGGKSRRHRRRNKKSRNKKSRNNKTRNNKKSNKRKSRRRRR